VQVVPTILKNHSAFVFSFKLFKITLETWGTFCSVTQCRILEDLNPLLRHLENVTVAQFAIIDRVIVFISVETVLELFTQEVYFIIGYSKSYKSGPG
jgi:hypothetical protein